jgi:hypothetical protein
MQDIFADLPSIDSGAQKDWRTINNRLLLLQRQWTRSQNLGPAYSLPEFARFWEIPERTIRHYAGEGLLPGLLRVGKRLKIRKTRETFEFGRAILSAQQARQVKRFVEENGSIVFSALGEMLDTKRALFLDSAHSQSGIENVNDEEVLRILTERAKAVEGVGEMPNDQFQEMLMEKLPADPVARMTEAERCCCSTEMYTSIFVMPVCSAPPSPLPSACG